jgi:uncharacterized cupin superfamily protein
MADPRAAANLFTTAWDVERGGVGVARVGARAGSDLLGASVYELAPHSKAGELHAHHANEELILVLSGTPTLRTAAGEEVLQPGAVVACRIGLQGAHALVNRSEQPARVAIVSTLRMPDVVEYPEREEVFVMTEPPYGDGDPGPAGRHLRVYPRGAGPLFPPDR